MSKPEYQRLIGVILLLLNTVPIASCRQKQGSPLDQDVATKMQAYSRQGRYDDAMRAGLNAIKGVPSDDVIYQQLAMVCAKRAPGNKDHQEKWSKTAAEYSEKALQVHPNDLMNTYNAARSYEVIGDLSFDNKCAYYDRSLRLAAETERLSNGGSALIRGQSVSTAPIRKDITALKSRLTTKRSDAGCK